MRNKINKKIGIIGGVGPQASAYLYSEIIKIAQEKYGVKENNQFPEIILYSIPVPDFISDLKNLVQAKQMFQRVIFSFQKIGVDYIAIGSNTVHLLLGDFQKITKIKFISMIEVVAGKIILDNRKKVGILSSSMTKESGLYSKKLQEKGIEFLYPDNFGQKKVEEITRGVLAGRVKQESREEYLKVIDRLFSQGAEAIILGCTELPLAVNYEMIKDRIYNSTFLLAEKIVDLYYQGGSK